MAATVKTSLIDRLYKKLAKMKPEFKKLLLLIGALSVLLNIGALLYILLRSDSIKITFDKTAGVSVELAQNEQDYKEAFEKLFDSEISKKYVSDWLKTRSFYHIEDLDLVEKLGEMLPIVDEDNPIELQKRYSELLSQHKILKKLRDCASQYLPPFQYIGTKVKIGVPEKAENRPPKYKVNVPFDSAFVGKRIKIYSPYSSNIYLTLEGKPAFQKTDTVDMQLNTAQAIYLFSSISAKTVTGIAYILPSSEELFDPGK